MSDTDTIVQRSVRGPQVYDTHKYACMIHIHTYMRVKMWPAGLQIMYPNLHIEMYIYSPQSTSWGATYKRTCESTYWETRIHVQSKHCISQSADL